MRMPWCLWPFGGKCKRRRELSKRKSTRKGTFPERGGRPARTTDAERRHMFNLYGQGHGAHAIANKTGYGVYSPLRAIKTPFLIQAHFALHSFRAL